MAKDDGSPVDLVGEMMPTPRGELATALLALTGILLVARAARLLARYVLAYRRPAELSLSHDGGLRLRWRTEMLDRTLRDGDVHVPRGSLVRASREVLYPRLASYAGLLALVTGSYLGVSTLVDGVRAGSPSLIAGGLVVVAAGLGLDFLATVLVPGFRGRCRIVVVPRDGQRLCIGAVDVERADAFLAKLASIGASAPSSSGA
jgi:hypothetical protein